MPKSLYKQVFILVFAVALCCEGLRLSLRLTYNEDLQNALGPIFARGLLALFEASLVSAVVLTVLHTKVGRYISKLLDISKRSRMDKIVHLDSGNLPNNEIADLFISYERLLFALEEHQVGLGTRLVDAERNFLRAAKFSATGELTSTIVHDIRSPLSSILGYTQLALESTAKEGGKPSEEHLKKILRAAEHIHDLVKRMSLFSRHSEDLAEGVSLAECISDTLLILEHHLLLNKVILEKPELDSQCTAWGNKQLIIQVLVNLIANAVDALEGSAVKKVVLTVQESPDSFEVCVRDTGPGIPEEYMKQIFRPFFTTKGEGKGTGLGLASCRDIASLLGSKLTARNDAAQGGAVFQFILWKTADAAKKASSFERDVPPQGFEAA